MCLCPLGKMCAIGCKPHHPNVIAMEGNVRYVAFPTTPTIQGENA